MSKNIIKNAITDRYNTLAEDSCCLSCGNAGRHSKIQLGETVIDLGSGRGTELLKLAQETGSQGKAFGIDVSAGMINKARRNTEKLGISNTEFIQSELSNIPLPEKTADVIISNCTLNHCKNKEKVWQEIYRLLKNKGRFIISDIYASKTVPAKYAMDPEAIAECWAGAVTKSVYLKMIKEAGFKDIEILEESAPYKKGNIEVSSFTIRGSRPCACSE